MNKLLLFCSAFMLLAFTQTGNAQKFGHVNSSDIIQAHPMVISANTQLDAYQKGLMEPYDAQSKAFEAQYKAFVDETNSGTLSQVATQTKQAALQTQQDSLASMEQQIKFKVMQKREALLRPILTEVDSIIQVIGKEGHYTMIFDTSVSGALLFAEEGNDLTETVKSRLKK